jgi:hypothetical protein
VICYFSAMEFKELGIREYEVCKIPPNLFGNESITFQRMMIRTSCIYSMTVQYIHVQTYTQSTNGAHLLYLDRWKDNPRPPQDRQPSDVIIFKGLG